MESYAVTVYVGDKDGFGYGDATGYFDSAGTAPDRNGNGVLIRATLYLI